MQAEALDFACQGVRDGKGMALAVVISTWGSSPCPAGSLLAVSGSGEFAGSVSGGCVETAVIEAALETLTHGGMRLLEFGVTHDRAWEVGLACGGTVRILVQPIGRVGGIPAVTLERMLSARNGGDPLAVLTHLGSGEQRVATLAPGDGPGALSAEEWTAALDTARVGRCKLLDGEGTHAEPGIFIQVFQRSPRLFIIGAVHIAQHLAAVARRCGHEALIIDPRPAFATVERFRDVPLQQEWPDRAMAREVPDHRTAVVVLSHDPKLDDPALVAALRSPAYYIGALGSRKNHANRLARLASQGFDAAALARIRGPVGLDIGAATPAEIAIAIMAELVQSLRK